MSARKVLLFGMLLGAAALGGCGTDCEMAADHVSDKFIECGLKDPNAVAEDATEDEPELDCPDEAGSRLLCEADCLVEAECGAIDGSDGAAAAALAECQGKC